MSIINEKNKYNHDICFSEMQNMIDSKLLEAEDEAANTLIRFSSTEILDDVYKILKSTNL